jgi:hypothetical protein
MDSVAIALLQTPTAASHCKFGLNGSPQSSDPCTQYSMQIMANIMRSSTRFRAADLTAKRA